MRQASRCKRLIRFPACAILSLWLHRLPPRLSSCPWARGRIQAKEHRWWELLLRVADRYNHSLQDQSFSCREWAQSWLYRSGSPGTLRGALWDEACWRLGMQHYQCQTRQWLDDLRFHHWWKWNCSPRLVRSVLRFSTFPHHTKTIQWLVRQWYRRTSSDKTHGSLLCMLYSPNLPDLYPNSTIHSLCSPYRCKSECRYQW